MSFSDISSKMHLFPAHKIKRQLSGENLSTEKSKTFYLSIKKEDLCSYENTDACFHTSMHATMLIRQLTISEIFPSSEMR